VESVANKYTFIWRKTTESNKKKLEEKIRNILTRIDEGIAQDSQPEPDTSVSAIDSVISGSLIEKINGENKRLQGETVEEKEELLKRKKQVKELQEHKETLEEYEDKLDKPGDRNSYSKTDTDATFMRMKEDAMNNGQTKPGYSLQTGTEKQYITNFGLFPNPGDTLTLIPFPAPGMARLGKLPNVLCADAGYGS
jgi:hypothetical protein